MAHDKTQVNPIEEMYENSKLPLPDHSQTKNGHVTQEIETNRIKLKTGFCL